MVSHFRPLLLPARARGTHFLLPLGSVILQLGVPQATVKAGWPVAFPRLATEKGSRWLVLLFFLWLVLLLSLVVLLFFRLPFVVACFVFLLFVFLLFVLILF